MGCGTGDLANDISAFGASVLGVDASATMILAAQQKYPAITFQTMEATAMHFPQQFDAVFSNAALHWMKEPDVVIENVYGALKNGGRFVAEMGGQGNIASIVWALQNSMDSLKLPISNTIFLGIFQAPRSINQIRECRLSGREYDAL